MKDDIYLLKLAVKESQKSKGPHKYGALVVKDGKIISSDHNRVREIFDPSAHAEVNVIKTACRNLKVYNLPPGFTLYASAEPCLMCFMCAAWAGIERVVYFLPASEQDSSSYGFEDFSVSEFNQKLIKPFKIEQINIGKNWGEL